MESFLVTLQNEVEDISLTSQQEDAIFLALAGLKQVGLLTHFVGSPFSNVMC